MEQQNRNGTRVERVVRNNYSYSGRVVCRKESAKMYIVGHGQAKLRNKTK